MLKHLLFWFAVLPPFELKKRCKSGKIFRIMWKSRNCFLVWMKWWLNVVPHSMLKHVLIWFAVLSLFVLKKLCKSGKVFKIIEISTNCLYMNEIMIRCCSPFNAETYSVLICSATALWIEETVQKCWRVQNHVKIKELLSGMNEIMIRCCPFNAETCSNLICSATSFCIEETVQEWKSVQNHVNFNKLPLYEWNNA